MDIRQLKNEIKSLKNINVLTKEHFESVSHAVINSVDKSKKNARSI